jgi:hypothetical protein
VGVAERLRPCKDRSTTDPASTASDSTIVFGIERMMEPPER